MHIRIYIYVYIYIYKYMYKIHRLSNREFFCEKDDFIINESMLEF
jgi:hypothetical protein